MPMTSGCSCARRWYWRRCMADLQHTGRDSGSWRRRRPMSDAGAPPILTQRRIEAAFAKGVYEEMKAELGEETAKRILSSAVIKLAKQAAAGMAKDAPGGVASLDSFRAIQPRWTAEDALRIEVVESNEHAFHFNVVRCRYAEMYRAMGL